jgi:hypothetical protein
MSPRGRSNDGWSPARQQFVTARSHLRSQVRHHADGCGEHERGRVGKSPPNVSHRRKAHLSPTSPFRAERSLVAPTPSWDLLVHAKLLFVGARQQNPKPTIRTRYPN